MPPSLEEKISFRNKVVPILTHIESIFFVSPRIALIQSALESNWGVSELATQGMNIFSITPGSQWISAMNKSIPMSQVPNWSALGKETVHYPTTEYSKLPPNHIRYWEFDGDIISKKDDGKGGSILVVDRHFRKYLSWEESCWDWARKIAKSELYHVAYNAAKVGDLQAFANALESAGYATDAGYVAELLGTGRAVDALPPTGTV